jgi:pimeloyl-ACP methyl ester carboxylesterase
VTTPLHYEIWGEGPPAILVHQSAFAGRTCFVRQRALGRAWKLYVLDRRGYGSSPPAPHGEDVDVDSQDVADFFDDVGGRAHLCGVSYGGTACLLAAAMRPGAVRSLAVVEPSAFWVAMDRPGVRDLVSVLNEIYDSARRLDAREYLVRALAALGGEPEKLPNPLTPALTAYVDMVRRTARTWAVPIPVEQLARARFPKLVISGGHMEAWETVCDVLAERIGAERAIVPGQHSVQLAGEPFNRTLDLFWRSADTR